MGMGSDALIVRRAKTRGPALNAFLEDVANIANPYALRDAAPCA